MMLVLKRKHFVYNSPVFFIQCLAPGIPSTVAYTICVMVPTLISKNSILWCFFCYPHVLTWLLRYRLTAFVVKTFHQAKAHIFVDDEVLIRAIDWMFARQNSDGSFPEPGRVIHKNMQVRAVLSVSL